MGSFQAVYTFLNMCTVSLVFKLSLFNDCSRKLEAHAAFHEFQTALSSFMLQLFSLHCALTRSTDCEAQLTFDRHLFHSNNILQTVMTTNLVINHW